MPTSACLDLELFELGLFQLGPYYRAQPCSAAGLFEINPWLKPAGWAGSIAIESISTDDGMV